MNFENLTKEQKKQLIKQAIKNKYKRNPPKATIRKGSSVYHCIDKNLLNDVDNIGANINLLLNMALNNNTIKTQ